LAAVSKTPGRTRSVNVYEVAHGKWLIDLPGYGYAEASEKQREYWPKMIALTLAGRPTMARVYVLLDAERGVMPIDQAMIGWLRESKIPFVMVGTKVDRLSQSKQLQMRTDMAKGAGFFPNEIFWVSAKKGYGLKQFEKDVVETLGLS
jgi:GTP-binding protein